MITTRADVRQGDLRETGVPLNLAVDGEGFTVVSTPRVSDASERKLRQGALEASNVEPVSTMVELLGIQRHHALLERAIRVLNDARGADEVMFGSMLDQHIAENVGQQDNGPRDLSTSRFESLRQRLDPPAETVP